jgi:DNA repair exonuclease SbcCD ATPase subunit
MKIVKLQSENIKRIRAVEVTPDPKGGLVIIGGNNEQGKTSVLDSIMYALGGKGTIPPEPLRKGAEHGHATVHLDEQNLLVTRTFTEAGGGQLRVETTDGAMFRSPQKMLDDLVGALSFDPVAFKMEKPQRQVEIVRKLVGIDTTKLDGQRMKLYEDRTAQNRELKRREASLEILQHFPDAPEEELSISELTRELEAIDAQEREYLGLKESRDSLLREQHQAEKDVEKAVARIKQLMEALDTAKDQHTQYKALLEKAQGNHANAQNKASGFAATIPTKQGVIDRITAAEGTNEQVRANQAYAKAFDEAKAARAVAADLSAKIVAIDNKKQAMIAKAKFPVPDLGFGENGLTLNGHPFEQASGAEQIQVSVAMGFSLNPKCKVLLVRDGSSLDDAHLELVAKLASEHDGQVWIERVGDRDEAAVIIEDGVVRGSEEVSADE